MSVNLGSAHGEIRFTSNIDQIVQRVDRELGSLTKQLGSKIDAVGQQMMGLGASLAPFSAASAGFLATGTQAFIELDSALTEISARTGVTGDELKGLESTIVDLAANTVFGSNEVSAAMLQLLTSGMSLDEALTTLPHVLNASAASATDLGIAADQTTNVMSVFGIGASEAQRVVDQLVAAGAESPATFTQLSDSLVRAGSSAQNLGISMEDMLGVMVGISPVVRGSEAGTSVNSMFRNMTRDIPATTEALNDLGVSLYDSEGNFRGIEAVFSDLESALSDLDQEARNQKMFAIFGSEGMAAATALMNMEGSLSDVTTAIADQRKASEVAEGAFGSLRNQLNSLKGSFEAFQVEVLRPFIEKDFKPLIENAIEIVNRMREWAVENRELSLTIVRIASVVAALAPTLIAIGSIVSGVGVAIATLASPVGLAVAGFTALTIAYKTNFMGFQDVVNGIPAKAMQMWAQLQPILNAFKAWFMSEGLPNIIAGLQSLGALFQGLWAQISPVLSQLADWFTTTGMPLVIQTIQQFIASIQAIQIQVSPTLMSLMSIFQQVFMLIYDVVANLVLPIMRNFLMFMMQLGMQIISIVVPQLQMFFQFMWNGIQRLVQFIDTVLLPSLQFFVDYLISIWTLVEPPLTAFQNGFVSAFQMVIDNAIKPLQQAMENIMSVIDRFMDKVNEAMSAAQNLKGLGDQSRAVAGAAVSNPGGFFGAARNAIAAEFRDKGGKGSPGEVYAIGKGAGVEGYVTPQARGDFIPNLDKLIAAAADGAGGTTNIYMSPPPGGSPQDYANAVARELTRRG